MITDASNTEESESSSYSDFPGPYIESHPQIKWNSRKTCQGFVLEQYLFNARYNPSMLMLM